MKTLFSKIAWITVICAFIIVNPLLAQNGDTTKIRMGKKRIIIIEEDENKTKTENLENSKQKFQADLKLLEQNIQEIQEKLRNTNDSVQLKKLKEQASDLSKQKDAIEKGIATIEEDLYEEKNKHENIDEENEDEMKADLEIEKELDNEFELLNEFGKMQPSRFKGHWFGIDIGLNNFMGENHSSTLQDDAYFMELNSSKSWGVNINFIQYSIPLHSKNIGLVTGLGFHLNNFRLEGNYQLETNNQGAIVGVEPTDKILSKSTLNMNYLTAPLMLEFQIPVGKKNKPIHLAVGVTGGIKIGSKTKQIYNGEKHKLKGDYALSQFRYGLRVSAGYRILNVFANYSLVPLFEKNKGPELFPFTVGLSFL